MNQKVHKGGCLCGRIRYSLNGEPDFPHYCSCKMCQRVSGAPITAWADFLLPIVYEGDEPVFYRSSNNTQRAFCPECGSSLFALNDGSDSVCVMLGTLDHPDSIVPETQSYPESAPKWLKKLV